MGEFAGCTFVQWARYGQLSSGRLLLVWTSLREWPTPQFLLPSISILPMDPSGRQTGWFCILHLKDLSMNDLSAVRCNSILHCISWLNLFFPIYELEIFPVVVPIRAWSKFVTGKVVFHYLDSVAARSAFILQVLRPPWVPLWLRIM